MTAEDVLREILHETRRPGPCSVFSGQQVFQPEKRPQPEGTIQIPSGQLKIDIHELSDYRHCASAGIHRLPYVDRGPE